MALYDMIQHLFFYVLYVCVYMRISADSIHIFVLLT